MSMQSKAIEPYRILFPVGVCLAILGVIPWILFSSGVIAVYPNLIHARIMISGFLMSFVSGFLMTAVPKMSGSKSASGFEVSICVLLILFQVFLALFNFLAASAIVGCLQFLFLAAYLGIRIKERTQDPPSIFIFIPFGILSGFVGYVILFFQQDLSSLVVQYGKLLLYQAFILNLIVGLGSRLIPVLSRVPGALSPLQQGVRKMFGSAVVLVLINGSFVIEAFVDKPIGLGLRFLVMSYVLLVHFKVFTKMIEFSFLGFCLRVAAVFMAVPYLLILIWPAYELNLLHLYFISGFSLMTLMVAVRVILSHGGHSLTFETESKALIIVAGLAVAATVVRSLGPIFWPQLFLSWIVMASIFWMAAIVFWSKIFWSKIFYSLLRK